MALVIVATPLGNLGDITLRAIEALRNAEVIVAEDTRVARRLLHALAIEPKLLWSYREQNAGAVTEGILERARMQAVVLVSDAGMPGISDPGHELVAAARSAGIPIDVLPGPSAMLGVAVLSGFSLRRFSFEGFPPRTGPPRRAAFQDALKAEATTIWYESPQRIRASLADLDAVAPDAKVFLVREYTKKFEQQLLGTASEIATALSDPVRGEIAFAIAPYSGNAPVAERGTVEDVIDELLEKGHGVRDVAKLLASRGLGDRRDLYAMASARKTARGMGTPSAAERPQT